MKQLDVIAERDLQNGEPEARPRYLEAETERLFNALNQNEKLVNALYEACVVVAADTARFRQMESKRGIASGAWRSRG